MSNQSKLETKCNRVSTLQFEDHNRQTSERTLWGKDMRLSSQSHSVRVLNWDARNICTLLRELFRVPLSLPNVLLGKQDYFVHHQMAVACTWLVVQIELWFGGLNENGQGLSCVPVLSCPQLDQIDWIAIELFPLSWVHLCVPSISGWSACGDWCWWLPVNSIRMHTQMSSDSMFNNCSALPATEWMNGVSVEWQFKSINSRCCGLQLSLRTGQGECELIIMFTGNRNGMDGWLLAHWLGALDQALHCWTLTHSLTRITIGIIMNLGLFQCVHSLINHGHQQPRYGHLPHGTHGHSATVHSAKPCRRPQLTTTSIHYWPLRVTFEWT